MSMASCPVAASRILALTLPETREEPLQQAG